MQLTRLSRLFFVFLISVVLPFANVAATAMPHCTQPAAVSPPLALAVTDDSMHYAHHHHMQAAQGMADDHCDQQQHHSSRDNRAGCNHCSYCQSCTFAMALQLAGQGFPDEAAVIEKFQIVDPVPQPFDEQPFHPPRYAFA